MARSKDMRALRDMILSRNFQRQIARELLHVEQHAASLEPCDACAGTGEGPAWSSCLRCGGTGIIGRYDVVPLTAPEIAGLEEVLVVQRQAVAAVFGMSNVQLYGVAGPASDRGMVGKTPDLADEWADGVIARGQTPLEHVPKFRMPPDYDLCYACGTRREERTILGFDIVVCPQCDQQE